MQPSLYFYPRPPRGGRPAQLSPAQHPQHFYPRPPRGGRHSFQNPGVPPYEFLSTPSARRATQHSLATVIHIRISIHALREEGDALRTPTITTTSDFYPRPPRGGRPLLRAERSISMYFYPRPPRGGRRPPPAERLQHRPISIHALREEGDTTAPLILPTGANFYPRPPRGGRPEGCHIGSRPWVFLSTPSARRATVCAHGPVSFSPIFLSTPSARRATSTTSELPFLAWISIHALREEGDFQSLVLIRDELLFLSTPSARRATSPEPSTSYTEG